MFICLDCKETFDAEDVCPECLGDGVDLEDVIRNQNTFDNFRIDPF